MSLVYIRNETSDSSKPGLVDISETGEQLARSPTPIGIMLVLDVLGISDINRVIESPDIDRHAGALNAAQYAELSALLSNSR